MTIAFQSCLPKQANKTVYSQIYRIYIRIFKVRAAKFLPHSRSRIPYISPENIKKRFLISFERYRKVILARNFDLHFNFGEVRNEDQR